MGRVSTKGLSGDWSGVAGRPGEGMMTRESCSDPARSLGMEEGMCLCRRVDNFLVFRRERELDESSDSLSGGECGLDFVWIDLCTKAFLQFQERAS